MALHVRDEGEELPVVLLHGLGASSRVFDHLFDPAVRGARRVITVDLPNTARSRNWARSTPEHITAELMKYLDRRRVSSFELFGHSFGGLVALEVARQAPGRVTGLTVASAPAFGVPSEFKLLLSHPLTDATMGWFGRLPVWRPMLRSYLTMIWGSARSLSDEHLTLYEEAVGAPGFSEAMLEALRSVGDFQLDVASLQAARFPRHVLWGEKDRLVHPMVGEQLARAIGARLEVLNDVGHCVPEEAPARLAALIRR